MSPTLRRVRTSSLVVVLLLLSILLFSNGSRLFAQTEEPEPAEETAPVITDAMQRFLDGREEGRVPESMAATPCVGGMAGPYACNNIDLMAFMPVSDFSASSTNDIWGWTDPLDGKEYALLGLNNGTAFVDITVPDSPIYLGKLPTHTSSSSWRDIKVYNDYAFIVSEASGHGMQVFDLTELRSVASPPATFSETAFYGSFGNAHNIAINEDSGYAYGLGTGTCSGGLHMVDISNPLSPSNAGCFSADGYTHDAQCVNYIGPDPDYAGAEVCFNSNTDTLTIVDVTNKATPAQISRTSYPGVGYTHQGWLLDGHRYFLLGDEADETGSGHNTRTYIWDLADLDNPVLLGNYTGPNPSIDHNMYIMDGYAYQSNYTSGLQILDLTDVATTNLQQIAYFDTYTPNNNASFNGTWSNYPYFDSGVVVVTGIGEGLFIVYPTLIPDFQMGSDENSLSVCGNGSDSLTLDISPRNGYTGTVTLSTTGLPAGASASFTPNPVSPPDTSDMTVTVSGTAANTYPFSVVGSDLPLSHTLDATLYVNDAAPGTTTLSSPADGAIDIDVQPTLSWTAASQAMSYYVEVATDAAFNTVVYSATTNATSHQVTAVLDPETTYFWRVQAVNICGSGPFSTAFSFTTRAIPPILLVDDDDNNPDSRSVYTTALDNLALDYDVWDTANSDNEPSFGLLAPYSVIIWFTGDEFGGAAGPSGGSEAELADWLDSGNCLFLSSQDYHYDRGQTSFMTNYLGFSSATDDDGNYSSVTGQGSVFSGMGPFSLSYPPLDDYSDIVSPSGSAELAFDGNNGNDAAVNKDSGTYRTVFFGFPFEAISSATARESILETFVTWCGQTTEVATLERNLDEIEETVTMGESVTRTLMVTNTGNISLTFAVSESAAWADVSPAGGTLNAGESMALLVTLDSSATAGAGTYNDAISFSGTFDNTPDDVDLILHVEEGPEETYESFIPVMVSGGGANASGSAAASLPWLLPIVGITAVVGIGRSKNRLLNFLRK